MYKSTRTRPDIAYAVGIASRYMENPNRQDITSVKIILLAGTLGHFKLNSEILEIKTYCDSDYAGDCETIRSTTGYVMMLVMDLSHGVPEDNQL